MSTGGSARGTQAMEPGSMRFLLRCFKRILQCNTAALERMAQMDRALGGEYVFDAAFLESSVREVCRLTHLSAYHLNGMAGEGFVELYDAALAVKDALEDILSGGMGPLAGQRVLPFAEIGWEMEPLTGLWAAGLAVLGARMGLPAPDGLAVTATGMRELAGPDAAQARDEVAQAVEALLRRTGWPRTLELSLEEAGAQGAGTILATAFVGTARDTAESARGGAETALAAAETARAWAGERAAPTGGPPNGRALAVCIRPGVTGAVSGTLQTLAHDPNLPPAMLAVSAPPDAPGLADRLWLSRVPPHDPLRARLSAKPLDISLPGGKPLDPSRGRSLRGSGWLTPDTAALLAEMGLAAERAMGGPCLLSWALSGQGAFTITSVQPALEAYPEWPGEQHAAQEDELPAPVLSGGQIACGGVGAGPVAVLDEDTVPDAVPLGCVGVARAAVPALSRIVPRLGALLAEVGTAASHLATVARENRVPSLFGLKGAMRLEPGAMVTVDADQATVYPGVAGSLLRQAAMQGADLGAEPEYRVLRRLLRHVRPLNLVDPQAPSFRPQGCRTCHDIIHFAHEKAVELLLGADAAGRAGLGAGRRLREDSPFELTIVDVGGGLAGDGGDVRLDDVRSLPLHAFLEGLVLREIRREEPANLRLGDIFSGMGRTSRALSGAEKGNLALAARDYANVTLRLGYHFSVVDAVVSDRPEHTFVYFRFAGGFADGDRRARRAGLILGVLERLGFRASLKGDLVVGKRKQMEAGEALSVLRLLGALSAYTRQLDVELVSDAQAARLARRFLETCGLAATAEVDG